MTPEQAAAQLPYHRRIEVWVALGALVFLLLLVETIRRHRLKESYSLLWFATIGGALLLTWKRAWLEWISYALGIFHVPSAFLLVLIGFLAAILFHFSTVISRSLTDRKVLAQRVGLLDARCRALERELRSMRAGAPTGQGSRAERDRR